jgi:hypothetical protein
MKIRPLTAVEVLVVLAILILLSGLTFGFPGDLIVNLAFGWIVYLYRTLPQVRINVPGILTATVCLSALAIGLQWFLHWLTGQMPNKAVKSDPNTSTWPARRTGVVLGLILLMFVAGISAVGISHQIGWLLTSPEPIFGGGIREVASRAQSANNLKQMVVAMHNYNDLEKTLPPAAVWNGEGQPLLSWRVLILPYVEQQSLYKEFHLDEPWDSPHNLRLLPRIPQIYAPCGGTGSVKPYCTPYQVFIGKGTAFEGKCGLRLPQDFPDGTAITLLIVEAAELVLWTKPDDLPFERKRPLPALGWSSRQRFPAGMADGSIMNISRQVSETTLRAAISRNGGETLGPDW